MSWWRALLAELLKTYGPKAIQKGTEKIGKEQ